MLQQHFLLPPLHRPDLGGLGAGAGVVGLDSTVVTVFVTVVVVGEQASVTVVVQQAAPGAAAAAAKEADARMARIVDGCIFVVWGLFGVSLDL